MSRAVRRPIDPNNPAPVRRDEHGRILPGQRAINPSGKAKGIERRMREIVDSQIERWDGNSLDGWEAMVVLMYSVAMGKKIPGQLDMPITMKDRLAAIQFLFDRVYGKAKITVESDTTLHAGSLANLDVDALSREDLEALEQHVDELTAKASGKTGGGAVIDIAPSDIEER